MENRLTFWKVVHRAMAQVFVLGLPIWVRISKHTIHDSEQAFVGGSKVKLGKQAAGVVLRSTAVDGWRQFEVGNHKIHQVFPTLVVQIAGQGAEIIEEGFAGSKFISAAACIWRPSSPKRYGREKPAG